MWGTSQRDVEVTQTILQQACVAFAAQGGSAVVVLSHRPKVEMEEFFMYEVEHNRYCTTWFDHAHIHRTAIPYEQRNGTQLVFRQGSPLDAQDLTNVAAQDAHAIIIVSDCSR